MAEMFDLAEAKAMEGESMRLPRKRSILMAITTLALAAGLAVVMALPGSATPPTGGQTSTILAQGTIAARGTDVVTALNVFPGRTATAVSSSGWHSHPGNTFVIVQSGAITIYKGSNPCHGRTFTAGQAFVEVPTEIYDGVNLGTATAMVYVTFKDVPTGGSPKSDQPAPATCPDPTA